MAKVITQIENSVVTQTCKRCGSNRVECSFWGNNPLIDYMNELYETEEPNPYKQRWSCWACEGTYDWVELSNAEEWVGIE